MHDIQLKPPFRRATPDDAHTLAELVDFAGEGMPSYLWKQMVAVHPPAGGADRPGAAALVPAISRTSFCRMASLNSSKPRAGTTKEPGPPITFSAK